MSNTPKLLCQRNAVKPKRTQPTIVGPTYYRVLHPTKGWRRVSNKRVAAQTRMAHLLGA